MPLLVVRDSKLTPQKGFVNLALIRSRLVSGLSPEVLWLLRPFLS